MDKSKFYKVLGLPNNASKEAVSKMYKLLTENYRPLIQSGKLDVSVLTELNMAYMCLMADNTADITRNMLDKFFRNNNFVENLFDLKYLIGILITTDTFYTFSDTIGNILGDYVIKINALLKKIMDIQEPEKLAAQLKAYDEIEKSLIKEFSFGSNNLGKYYLYCMDYMPYGVLDLEEFSKFNSGLMTCTSSTEIIAFLKSNLDFIIHLNNASEKMKKSNAQSVLVESDLNISEKNLLASNVSRRVSGEVIKNKFSLDELTNFYLGGKVEDIRKQAANSLGLAHKLNKKA